MTARFLTEQPSVRIAIFDRALVARVCVNGIRVEDVFDTPDGRGMPVTYWEYDYNEISADLAVIDVADLIAHPGKYINF